MANLSAYDGLQQAQDDGIDVSILDPKGNETDIVIRVAGPDSARQRNAKADVNNSNLTRAPGKKLTSKEATANVMKIMVASVISWTNVEEHGAPVVCTPETVEDVFTRYPFIYDQVIAVGGDRAGFIKS